MTVIASDNFNDSNNTLLQNHTPSGGGSWTKFVGGASNDLKIFSNGVVPANPDSSGVWYYHSVTPTGAEYSCQCTLKNSGDANFSIGLSARSSTSVQTAYVAWPGGAQWDLYRVVTGSWTSLGTYASQPLANDVSKLEVLDATKKLFVNGTQRISSSDNTITAAGKAGLRGYYQSNSWGLDDWSVDETVAAYVRPVVLIGRQAQVRASRW